MANHMGKIVSGVIVLVVALFIVVSYVTNYNYGNRAEATIRAEYENLHNVLGQYQIQIREAAQIPSMQTEDLERIFAGALGSRYGEDGSQAGMQWIVEQNPDLDQSTYLRIQQMIEGGRNKFQNHQSRFLDTKRGYETRLGYLWSGTWLSIAGYPKIDLSSYNIVTTEDARRSFETGVDTPMQLR